MFFSPMQVFCIGFFMAFFVTRPRIFFPPFLQRDILLPFLVANKTLVA